MMTVTELRIKGVQNLVRELEALRVLAGEAAEMLELLLGLYEDELPDIESGRLRAEVEGLVAQLRLLSRRPAR